jgi:hypothetical protein
MLPDRRSPPSSQKVTLFQRRHTRASYLRSLLTNLTESSELQDDKERI